MEDIEASGKSVDEAVARALEQLGLELDQIEVTVLQTGRSGLLGLGAEEARVRVRSIKDSTNDPAPTPQVVAELGQEILEEILSALRFQARVEVNLPSQPDLPVILNIRGDDLGILIGRRGSSLAALQYLVLVLLSRRLGGRVALEVDVDGYRQRRAQALHDLALRIAGRVTETGHTMSLEPMPPAERRLIHLALRDHVEVIAESVGEGEERKVTIRRRPR